MDRYSVPENQSPHWFRLHLSSAFMTMLLAAFLMALNMVPQPLKADWVQLQRFGWPWTGAVRVQSIPRWTEISVVLFGASRQAIRGECYYSWNALAADGAAFVVIVILGAMLFEWPVRRDERMRAERRSKINTAPTEGEVRKPFVRSRLNPLTLGLLGLAALVAAALQAVPRPERGEGYKVLKHGFPLTFAMKVDFVAEQRVLNDPEFDAADESPFYPNDAERWAVRTLPALLNIVICGALLAIGTVLFESTLRVREAALRARRQFRRPKPVPH